ncbi:MAG: MlaD family protein [Rhodoferax sp.]|nr:MlaD family protein [Rhodoferax sp.]
MNQHRARDRSRWLIGLFVAGGLLLLVAMVFGMALRQGWFDKTLTLHFESQSAEDLRKGMAVRLAGIAVGKVSRVELEDNARVLVSMQIQAEFQRFLRADAIAQLAHEGMFGDSYISITFDQERQVDTKKVLSDGARIPYLPGTNFGELLTQLRENVFPLLVQMQLFVTQLNAPQGALQSTLGESRTLLRELRGTRAQLEKTLAGVNQVTAEQVPKTLGQLDNTLKSYAELAQRTDAQLAAMGKTLDITLATYQTTSTEATQATRDMQTLIGETRPLLQQVLKNLDLLLRKSNQTVGNMQTHWPFTGDTALPPAEHSPGNVQAQPGDKSPLAPPRTPP